MSKALKYGGPGFHKSLCSVECDICGSSFKVKGILRHRSACKVRYACLQAAKALHAAHHAPHVGQPYMDGAGVHDLHEDMALSNNNYESSAYGEN